MKAAASFAVFSTTAITAVTAQNSTGVQGVHVLPPEFVKQQMTSVLDDLGTDVVKTGMLATTDIVTVVADQLVASSPHGVVVDPVMASRSGDPLLDPEAVDAYRKRLLPLATVLTPNLHEAQLLLNTGSSTEPGSGSGSKNGTIGDVTAMEDAARALAALGPKWVLLKGGGFRHQRQKDGTEAASDPGAGADGLAVDVLCEAATGECTHFIQEATLATCNTQGTGCTMASAIAAALAKGATVPDAVAQAKRYVSGMIANSAHLPLGTGMQRSMNHHWEKAYW